VIARVAVATRNRAFAEADRAAGDTNWGLACKSARAAHVRAQRPREPRPAPVARLVREGSTSCRSSTAFPSASTAAPPTTQLAPPRRRAARARAVQATAPQLAFDFMAGASADGPVLVMAMETTRRHGDARSRPGERCRSDPQRVGVCVEQPQEKVSPVVRLADQARRRRGAKNVGLGADAGKRVSGARSAPSDVTLTRARLPHRGRGPKSCRGPRSRILAIVSNGGQPTERPVSARCASTARASSFARRPVPRGVARRPCARATRTRTSS